MTYYHIHRARQGKKVGHRLVVEEEGTVTDYGFAIDSVAAMLTQLVIPGGLEPGDVVVLPDGQRLIRMASDAKGLPS